MMRSTSSPGADRNRRFIDDDVKTLQRLGDGFRGRVNIGEIRVPVAATRGRPDAMNTASAPRTAEPSFRRE